jgi:hypothetical protein
LKILYSCRYTDQFLKTKQEASGWPPGVESDEEKLQYISDYLEHEGIQLDIEAIVNNPGLREIAKLMLNSFWGKVRECLYVKCNVSFCLVCSEDGLE